MRVVFGFAAVAILLGGYTVCPDTVRASVADAVTPNEQVLEEIGDGVDTLMALFRGPGDIQPEDALTSPV